MVIIRDDLLERAADDLPSMLNYRKLADAKSLLNTAPTFAIYMVQLITDWLLGEIGGLDKMLEQNRRKAEMLYQAVDQSGGFYSGHADTEHRSLMNVTFRLPTPELEQEFLKQAAEQGLCALKGHRSVGGCRASIYNAMPPEGVEALRDFMLDFAKKGAD